MSEHPLPAGDPQAHGVSAAGIAAIDAFFQREIAASRLPGAVLAIAREGRLLHHRAYGMRDPVARVPDMLELCLRGHGVVVGVPESGFDEYPLRRWGSALFHGLNRRLSGMELYPGSSWFRVLSRSALNALAVSQYDTLPFRQATVSLGFNPGVLKYRRDPFSGKVPKPSFWKDVQQALDVLFMESGAPGMVMARAGVGGMLLSLLSGLPLWFLVFLLLTVLSQYVHRNLQRLQPRPAYVVMNEVSSAVEIRDAGRRNVVHESG